MACLPLGTATDLLASAQLAERKFFVEHDDVVLPGRPYHLSSELSAAPTPDAPAPSERVDHGQRPLDGVRVVTFSARSAADV